MPTPAQFLATGFLTWFGLLVLLIAIRMLRGDIEVSGMLTHDPAEAGQAVEPERVLMMAVVPFVVMAYIYEALHAPLGGEGRPSLPDVPEQLLTVLTGSNALFLAGKIARRR
jgi:hypothetical protein